MPRTDPGPVLTRRPGRHAGCALLAYVGLIVGTYVLGLGLGVLAGRGVTVHPVVWEPILFPGLFVLAPPVVAVLTLRTGGTVLGSVAVGPAPGIAFTILAVVAALLGAGPGDSPLPALALVFAGIGVVGALAGTAVSLVVERLLRSLVSR